MDLGKATDLILGKLESWLRGFIEMLPNLALAVVIVLAAWLLARLSRQLVERLIRQVSRKLTLIELTGNVVYLMVLLVGLFIALGVLQLDKTVTSLLAGAGIIGLALGIAFQDIAANFMSGVYMAIRSPFEEGDIIESQDKIGIVTRLSLRSTILRSFQGQYIIIPNKDIFQNIITNYSRLGKRRIDLKVGVSYGEDLEQVRAVTLNAIKALPDLLAREDISLYYTEFGDSSINFELRFWINFKKQPDYLQARSEAIIAIKKAYNKHNISIPFPIRTLDFGIKGGEKLNEVLQK